MRFNNTTISNLCRLSDKSLEAIVSLCTDASIMLVPDDSAPVKGPGDSTLACPPTPESVNKDVIHTHIATNLSPITASSLKKRARFSDFVEIKLEDEEEDEIHVDVTLRPKRPRLRGGGTVYSTPDSTKHQLPPTPSSTHKPRGLPSGLDLVDKDIQKDIALTAQSAEPIGNPRKRKRSSPTNAVSTVDEYGNEELIYESIEDDSEETSPGLQRLRGIMKSNLAAKHRESEFAKPTTGLGGEDDINEVLCDKDQPPPADNDDEPFVPGEWDFVESGSVEADESASDIGSNSKETSIVYTTDHNDWRQEQVFLNHILKARNEFTLMPSTWAMHFRGIPIPDCLFYEKTKKVSSRPRIYAHTDKYEFRGALNLRYISEVSSRVRDLRSTQAKAAKYKTKTEEEKDAIRTATSREMVKKLRRVLEDAVNWSQLDGDLIKYGDKLPPNVQILEVSGGESTHDEIQKAMVNLAEQWCDRMAQLENKVKSGDMEKVPQPPVIYGLVIMNHLVIIVSMDGSDPKANCHIPIQMNMVQSNQQQWNALAIMVTICWARDKLMETAKEMQLNEEEDAESDPDA